MLTTDETVRFVMSRDGYYVGQPLAGDGTFGDWSLARVKILHEKFHTITFERNLTDREVQTIVSHPILYWFILAAPTMQPGTNTWALMRCKYSMRAAPLHQHRTYRRSADGGGALV